MATTPSVRAIQRVTQTTGVEASLRVQRQERRCACTPSLQSRLHKRGDYINPSLPQARMQARSVTECCLSIEIGLCWGYRHA
jgi:hypothetical protein